MSASKGKILVVDDDRLVLATLTFGLAQAGFEVIDADNGDDAILLAREHRPELALLDIRMEGLSGFDVAAYLRDYLQIPFMFLSAFADEETVAKVYGVSLSQVDVTVLAGTLGVGAITVKTGILKLVGRVPVAGRVLRAVVAPGIVRTLGRLAIRHFEDRYPDREHTSTDQATECDRHRVVH